MVANRDVAVTTETVVDLPFGKLVRLSKDVETRQPRVLVLAPLSGHFATLLSGTIRTLLSDHEVSVTDWANARDVPLEQGHFGMDDYVSYIMRFLEVLGPRTLGEGNPSTSAQFYFVGSIVIQPPLAMVNEQMNEFQLV